MILILFNMWRQGFVYTLYDLCAHPEYIEPLRLEISEQLEGHDSLQHMPLLDSFLKESSRMNPSDSSKSIYFEELLSQSVSPKSNLSL